MDPSRLDNLIAYLEASEVSQDIIDSVVDMVLEGETYPQGTVVDSQADDIIRMRIADEPDWRKRASLAALLISKSL